MAKVSIIMGAYNCENTIYTCIESIIYQTYKDWEFIICDDCSTDNTYTILKDYEAKDRRIKILHNEKNMRLAASLNACLDVASGKYIARMDSDDECLPCRIEKQVNFLDAHQEYAVVGSSRIIFDESGNLGTRCSVEFPDKNILKKGTPFAHPTIMMRKSAYDALGGYTVSKKTMRAEDLDLWFRFYERGYTGYNIQEALYKYHESAKDYNKRSIKAGIQTAKVYFEGYKRLKFPPYVFILALKPIISTLIPKRMMKKYHNNKLK